MGATSIEWTDRTWSPLRVRVKTDAAAIAQAKGYTSLVQIAAKMAGHVGPHCEHVSPGCANCYAGTNNARCLPANGTGLPFDRRSRDLVEPFIDEKIFGEPSRWRRPRRISVENQSDLFGEWNSFKMIDRIFGMMQLCKLHTFQVLTKRADRMVEYLTSRSGCSFVAMVNAEFARLVDAPPQVKGEPLPLPNVWLGVSVENQAAADVRIPLLLQTPAAVRFLSVEPLLGPVNIQRWLPCGDATGWCKCGGTHPPEGEPTTKPDAIDWIIIGGESGPGARPMDVQWVRDIIAQTKQVGMWPEVFVKQLGAKPWDSKTGKADHLFSHCGHACECCDECPSNGGQVERGDHPQLLKLHDRKGGDMAEWSEDLRERQFPAVSA